MSQTQRQLFTELRNFIQNFGNMPSTNSSKLIRAEQYIDALDSGYIPMTGVSRSVSGNHFNPTDSFDPQLAIASIEYASIIQLRLLDTITREGGASDEECDQRRALNRRLNRITEMLTFLILNRLI